jgi:hypothetical protein
MCGVEIRTMIILIYFSELEHKVRFIKVKNAKHLCILHIYEGQIFEKVGHMLFSVIIFDQKIGNFWKMCFPSINSKKFAFFLRFFFICLHQKLEKEKPWSSYL